MIRGGFDSFRGRRILLLQGPVGSFFYRLARALEGVGARVVKVNFNGGDWLYYPKGATTYRGPAAHWPARLQQLLEREDIDLVLLFGDCRPLHADALSVARKLGVEIGVFEEGYIRPNFITLESQGVNGFSRLPRSVHTENPSTWKPPLQEQQLAPTFWPMARQALAYAVAHWLAFPMFPHYRHHRPIGVVEGLRWIRSSWRKPFYRLKERRLMDTLCPPKGKGDEAPKQAAKFYLVPLQVFNDTQVTVHAPFKNVPSFIRSVIESFAQHAPPQTRLVFKHHPLDRGHTDYASLISRLASELGVGDRTIYLHDQHLPTLLQQAAGVVVINSTVGLSALVHGRPTIACGTAVYDVPGLTFQGHLDEFWHAAPQARPDQALLKKFRAQLIARTQLNGSFYRPLASEEARAGLVWPARTEPLPLALSVNRSTAQTARPTAHSSGRAPLRPAIQPAEVAR